MSDPSADRNPVDHLAEEFAQRLRRGEHPTVEEYITRHPECADQIRELFPTLLMMEQLKPHNATLTGSFTQPASKRPSGAIPERLGEYRIVREIGRGGMGVVYEAMQESLGRRVALKVLPERGLGNTTYLERFRREARAVARLQHPNIIAVHGTSESDGVHYYAMQFIQGQGLDHVLNDLRRLRSGANDPTLVPADSMAHTLSTKVLMRQSGTHHPDSGPKDVAPTITASVAQAQPTLDSKLPSEQSQTVRGGDYYRNIATLGLQIAEALAYAHQEGILHRDIKPSNLILDGKGTVWVADFGLAKAEGTEELTGSGEIVGTLRYMPPERFNGESLPQSDLYSLGLTLYELLTLKPAFDDAVKTRLIDSILHEAPTPPRIHDRAIPRDLETIVLKCIAKEPTERYRSASELADDLRLFLSDQPIKARRLSWLEHAWRWTRRNPVVASLSALVLVLALVLMVQWSKKPSRPIEQGMTVEDPLPEPGGLGLAGYVNRMGENLYFRVNAKTYGSIWGTDVYTLDSILASVVIHAGLLQSGEEGIVKVSILPGQASYEGSSRNGVVSNSWQNYQASYRVELIQKTRELPEEFVRLLKTARPDPGTLVEYRPFLGQSFLFDVTGQMTGSFIWGTDIYTDDSSLSAAAVHTGLLRSGQRGILRVKILPGKKSYTGSTRNGMVSSNYESWLGSYQIEKVEHVMD